MPKYLLWALLLLFALASPFIGIASLDLDTLLETGSLSHRIFFDLRLPRMLLAFTVGGALHSPACSFRLSFAMP